MAPKEHGKKNMPLILFIAIILLIVAGIWIYIVIFHRANPQLTQTAVTLQTAAPSGAPSPTASPSAAASAGENPTLPEESLSIDNATFTVEIASTMLEQARGLSYRPSLGANDGMLFVFASATVQNFWMQGMNFPLDMIWIGGGKVVGFAQDAVPQPGAALWNLTIYSSPDGTDKVLEVNAGTVAKYDIKVGDTVTIG
ncbi:MAG TPA: DUF192 domain-containing protein [Candidatus Paceibacterota bacterium]|jgi:hypothetical protein|nr:DUF192 domain-containing protein [Candidatus Paceibacterota bacterium]